uniref:hypothetical protein n=1 Tax=Entomohabitans teleogrylli TaxID=1384589 RepID=UPI000AC61BC3
TFQGHMSDQVATNTDKESILSLVEKRKNYEIANYDKRLTKIDSAYTPFIPFVFKYVVPLLTIISYYYLPELGIVAPRENPLLNTVVVSTIVIALYAILWHRYGDVFIKHLLSRISSSGFRKVIRNRMIGFFTFLIKKEFSRLEGQHHVCLKDNELVITGPSRKQIRLTVTKIMSIKETEAFYQIATKLHNKLGLCHLIPKQSKIMDENVYSKNLNLIFDAIRLNAPHCQFQILSEKHSEIVS